MQKLPRVQNLAANFPLTSSFNEIIIIGSLRFWSDKMIYKAAHIDIVIVIKQFLSTENDFHTHKLYEANLYRSYFSN